MQTIKLTNGVIMPQLGYGVYQVSPEECERCVLDAIGVGYRSIDTAQAYHNEEGVGEAISKCGIDRKELFITTKIWIRNYGEEKAYESVLESLRKLKTDYIDLLLLHQPFNDYYGAWRALERAYKERLVRAIGVSNFYPDRFIDLASHVEIKPMVNQVETHVFNQQIEAQEIMDRFDCRVMSWGPFAEGKNDFFNSEVLASIGAKYDKSVAQTALRYLLQRGVILIPKSSHKERMRQNLDIFDFELTEEDILSIRKLDLGHSLFFSHYDPATVQMMMDWEKNF